MTLRHIRVQFANAGVALQQIDDTTGMVVRYVTLDGDLMFVVPPVGDECRVTNPAPTVRAAVRTKAATREATLRTEQAARRAAEEAAMRYDWTTQGDRRDPASRGRRATDA